jgi:hypothetical protein
MPAALGRSKREAQTRGCLLPGELLERAQLVDSTVITGQALERRSKESRHFADARQIFGRRPAIDSFDPVLFECRELQQREEGFSSPQLPADAACDAAKPTAKGLLVLQRSQAAISLEQRFDQDILGIFAIAANAQHLPVDRIFVLMGQAFEVHRVARLHLMAVLPIHRHSLVRGRASRLCRVTVLCGSKGTGQEARPWDKGR